MASNERISKAINILDAKGATGDREAGIEIKTKLNVLKHGDCATCSHFDIELIDFDRLVRLVCKRGLDPMALFPGDWMIIDKKPKCTSQQIAVK